MNRPAYRASLLLAIALTAAVVVRPAIASFRRTSTKLTLSATPIAIDPGRTGELSGKLSSKRASCRTKQKVTLFSVKSGTKTKLGTTRTTSRGKYVFEQVVSAATTFQTVFTKTRSCKASASRTVTVTVFQLAPPTLQGPGGDPAGDHIPDVQFPNPQPEDYVFSDAAGAIISTQEFLLSFAPGTTVQQANDLLASIGATIQGGNPGPAWVLVRLDQPTSADDYLALFDQLGSNPLVSMVSPDVLLEPDRTPPPDPGFAGGWNWTIPPSTGAWGLGAIRAPQAWNLIDELRRSQDVPPLVGEIDSGFDTGNKDLKATANSGATVQLDTLGDRNPNPTRASDRGHGTGTAGVIAARFGNAELVDGVAPREGGKGPTVIGVPMRTGNTLTPVEQRILANRHIPLGFGSILRVIDDLERINEDHPEIKVFNLSLGFGFDTCHPAQSIIWRAGGVSGTTAQQATAQRIVEAMAEAFKQMFPAITEPSAYLLFGAAGNSSDLDGSTYPIDGSKLNPPQDCRIDLDGNGTFEDPGTVDIPSEWASPWCHAAVHLSAKGVMCVEATRLPHAGETGYPRANFSNGGADLAAPGTAIGTLWAGNAPPVFVANGTSFASPMAAGGAAWLYAFGNRGPFAGRPAQQLSLEQITDLLAVHSDVAPDGTSAVDMYSILLALDQVNGNKLIQKAIVDVDDGSLLDGNARLDNDDENNNGNREETYKGIGNDRLRGDGTIDMKDFRAFRDAFLLANLQRQEFLLDDIKLDGPATHFKRDLNFDGCVGSTVASPPWPADVLTEPSDCSTATVPEPYSRFDFNGDGIVNGEHTDPDASEVAPFGDPTSREIPAQGPCTGLHQPVQRCLRDIDVLADPDLWQVDDESVYVTPPPDIFFPCEQHPMTWTPQTSLLADFSGPQTDAPDGIVDYLYSADLHIDVAKDPTGDMDHVFIDVSSERPPDGKDNDGDGVVDELYEESWTRCLDTKGAKISTILTVPLFTNRVKVTVLGVDNDVDQNGNLTDDPYRFVRKVTLKYGQDSVFVVKAHTSSARELRPPLP